MKLKAEYREPNADVDYKLDTGDGQFCKSRMAGPIADEIVRRADSVEERGEEVLVNAKMLFPRHVFEDGEAETPAKPTRRRKAGQKSADGE